MWQSWTRYALFLVSRGLLWFKCMKFYCMWHSISWSSYRIFCYLQWKLSPIHTADADATQLSSWVASAVCIEFATSWRLSRRVSTSLNNLPTTKSSCVVSAVWRCERTSRQSWPSFQFSATAPVTYRLQNCKLGHDSWRACTHRRHKKSKNFWGVHSPSQYTTPTGEGTISRSTFDQSYLFVVTEWRTSTFDSVEKSSWISLVELLGDSLCEVVDHVRLEDRDANKKQMFRLLVDAELTDGVQNDISHLFRRSCPVPCRHIGDVQWTTGSQLTR